MDIESHNVFLDQDSFLAQYKPAFLMAIQRLNNIFRYNSSAWSVWRTRTATKNPTDTSGFNDSTNRSASIHGSWNGMAPMYPNANLNSQLINLLSKYGGVQQHAGLTIYSFDGTSSNVIASCGYLTARTSGSSEWSSSNYFLNINRSLFGKSSWTHEDRAAVLVHEFLHAIGITSGTWGSGTPRCLSSTIEANGICFLDPPALQGGLSPFSTCKSSAGMGVLQAYREGVRDNGLTRIRIQDAIGSSAGAHFEFRAHTTSDGVLYPGLCGEIMVPTFDRALSRAGMSGISDMTIETLKEYGYEIVPGAQAEVSNTPNRGTGMCSNQRSSNIEILQMKKEDENITCGHDHDMDDIRLEAIRKELNQSIENLD